MGVEVPFGPIRSIDWGDVPLYSILYWRYIGTWNYSTNLQIGNSWLRSQARARATHDAGPFPRIPSGLAGVCVARRLFQG
jgi:hypothetical protein